MVDVTSKLQPEAGTGSSSGIRGDALSAVALSQEAMKKEAAANEKAKATKTKGTIEYEAIGQPVFNCHCDNRAISFLGGSYFLLPEDPDFDAIRDTLTYHVKKGSIRIVTDGE